MSQEAPLNVAPLPASNQDRRRGKIRRNLLLLSPPQPSRMARARSSRNAIAPSHPSSHQHLCDSGNRESSPRVLTIELPRSIHHLRLGEAEASVHCSARDRVSVRCHSRGTAHPVQGSRRYIQRRLANRTEQYSEKSDADRKALAMMHTTTWVVVPVVEHIPYLCQCFELSLAEKCASTHLN